MSGASEHAQAEKLRAQIARMVAGNGLPPAAVTVQAEITTRVKLLGTLDVRLHAKTETTHGKGNALRRWRQTYDSLADLNAGLAALQTETLKNSANIHYAADQILLETNQGWGLHGTDLPISHLDFEVGAKDSCTHCKGEKFSTCKTCSGTRRHECDQCRGNRNVQCQTCFGRMQLPSGEDCPACRRQGTVLCPSCQGQGTAACRACGGKGNAPCAVCDATGSLWQQIGFHMFAQTNFKMSLGAEYHEDILQHIRRLRPEHLLDGRATITHGEKTIGDGVVQVAYNAEFPIIQIELNVAGAPARFVLLGEKHTMVEATHFMDRLLAPSLDLLRRARARQIAAPQALGELAKIRFYRDALRPGKKSQDLRRHYPLGINPSLLREVPQGLQYLLSILTEQPRMLAAIGFNAVLAIVMLYFAKTHNGPKQLQFSDICTVMGVVFANLLILLGTHFGVTHQTLKSFGAKPNLNGIAITAALGKTGLISIGVSLILCLLALMLR